MSRVTRRKHVLKEMMEDDYELPKAQQKIVRVVSSRGNNLHEVESEEAASDFFLASMPNKFRKNLWVKRGDFVLVEPIDEGDKVKAEICKILTTEHIKVYTKAGVWPAKFTKQTAYEPDNEAPLSATETDSFVVRNINRPAANLVNVEDESTDSDTSND